MWQSDLLMLVAIEERCAATNSPKGAFSFNCLHFGITVSPKGGADFLVLLHGPTALAYGVAEWGCAKSSPFLWLGGVFSVVCLRVPFCL